MCMYAYNFILQEIFITEAAYLLLCILHNNIFVKFHDLKPLMQL